MRRSVLRLLACLTSVLQSLLPVEGEESRPSVELYASLPLLFSDCWSKSRKREYIQIQQENLQSVKTGDFKHRSHVQRMRFSTLEIRWHDTKPIFSCDFQPFECVQHKRQLNPYQRTADNVSDGDGSLWRVATAGGDNNVRVRASS